MVSKNIKLSTKPYKGCRDFYPEDMALHKWLFEQMRDVVESYGYQEYDAPLLEPFELYAAKTGEEIVNEQLYSFEDRGQRKVAIRPEMTPTLARMVAARGVALPKPVRWYSTPNLWRYERPQRGRLREHWQLNVDILGINQLDAEFEILTVAIDLMRRLGATHEDFEIQINNRHLTNHFFENILHLSETQRQAVARAIDKRNKISAETFDELLEQADCSQEQRDLLLSFLAVNLQEIADLCGDNRGLTELNQLFELLTKLELLPYCTFSPTIMRGLDYYTGTVFEIFDRSPENRRALFGGGRYDNLVSLFGTAPLSGVGFGMGDVTLKDFLATHQLLPKLKAKTEILVALFSESLKIPAYCLARQLRNQGFKVEAICQTEKMGKQYQYADKKGIPIVVLIGPDEHENQQVKLKDLRTGEQQSVAEENLVEILRTML